MMRPWGAVGSVRRSRSSNTTPASPVPSSIPPLERATRPRARPAGGRTSSPPLFTSVPNGDSGWSRVQYDSPPPSQPSTALRYYDTLDSDCVDEEGNAEQRPRADECKDQPAAPLSLRDLCAPLVTPKQLVQQDQQRRQLVLRRLGQQENDNPNLPETYSPVRHKASPLRTNIIPLRPRRRLVPIQHCVPQPMAAPQPAPPSAPPPAPLSAPLPASLLVAPHWSLASVPVPLLASPPPPVIQQWGRPLPQPDPPLDDIDTVMSSVPEELMDSAWWSQEEEEEPGTELPAPRLPRLQRSSAAGHALRRALLLCRPLYTGCRITREEAAACLCIIMVHSTSRTAAIHRFTSSAFLSMTFTFVLCTMLCGGAGEVQGGSAVHLRGSGAYPGVPPQDHCFPRNPLRALMCEVRDRGWKPCTEVSFCAQGLKPNYPLRKEPLCDRPHVFYPMSLEQAKNLEGTTCGSREKKTTYLITIAQHIQVTHCTANTLPTWRPHGARMAPTWRPHGAHMRFSCRRLGAVLMPPAFSPRCVAVLHPTHAVRALLCVVCWGCGGGDGARTCGTAKISVRTSNAHS